MSGTFSYIKCVTGMAALLICVLPAKSHAIFKEKCDSSTKTAKAQCQTAIQGAGAADAASAAAKGAAAGNAINPNAGAQGQQIAEQTGRLQQAKSQCEAAKEKCKSDCETAKGQAQGSKPARDAGEPGQIESTKNNDCIAGIAALIAPLDKALGDLGQAGQGTDATKGSSGGMPMPIPIPPKDDKKDEPKPATDTAGNQPLDCTQSANTKFSDCNDYYINKCSGNMGQEGCDTFIGRYCGPMNSSTPAPAQDSTGTPPNPISNFSISSTSSTANLVVDKQGEGMGSQFCGKANGYRFCQASGRTQCPSCQSISSWSSAALSTDQLKSAQNSCPSDPMFADPAIAAQLSQSESTTPVTSTSGVSTMSTQSLDRLGHPAGFSQGGSGSGMAGGAGSNAGRAESGQGGIAEGSPLGMGMDVANGGGGGSSHGDGESSSSHAMAAQSTGGHPRSPAGNLVSTAKDVANQYGPNIFSISTTTYRALCTRGRLLHCRER